MTMLLVQSLKNAEATASLSEGHEDRLAAAIVALGRHPDGLDGADGVVEVLRETASARIRNTAALALSDMGARDKAGAIVDVLRRPDIAKSAGTLLFALGELDGRLPLDVAARLIASGSFEARAEALTFLEEGRIERVDEVSETKARALLTESVSGDDDEAAEAARLALDYVSDMPEAGRRA